MSDDVTIKLGPDYGTALFRAARNTIIPEKVGDTEFTGSERATFARWLNKLAGRLKEYSPITQKSRRHIFFGPEKWWRKTVADEETSKKEGTKKLFEVVEEFVDEVEEVSLCSTAEKKALYIISFVFLHPKSPYAFPPGMQEDMVWPWVRALGEKTVNQMEKAIGLADAKGIEVEFGNVEKEDDKKDGGA